MIVLLTLITPWALATTTFWSLGDRLTVIEVRAEVAWPKLGAPRGVHLSPTEVRDLEAKLEESFVSSVLRAIPERRNHRAASLRLDIRGEDIMEVRSSGQPRLHVPANLSLHFYPSGLVASHIDVRFYLYPTTSSRIVHLKSIDNAPVGQDASALLIDALISRGCQPLLSKDSTTGR